jgi:hypothetical protein
MRQAGSLTLVIGLRINLYEYRCQDIRSKHTSAGAPSSNLALKRNQLSVHNGTITQVYPTSGRNRLQISAPVRIACFW